MSSPRACVRRRRGRHRVRRCRWRPRGALDASSGARRARSATSSTSSRGARTATAPRAHAHLRVPSRRLAALQLPPRQTRASPSTHSPTLASFPQVSVPSSRRHRTPMAPRLSRGPRTSCEPQQPLLVGARVRWPLVSAPPRAPVPHAPVGHVGRQRLRLQGALSGLAGCIVSRRFALEPRARDWSRGEPQTAPRQLWVGRSRAGRGQGSPQDRFACRGHILGVVVATCTCTCECTLYARNVEI